MAAGSTYTRIASNTVSGSSTTLVSFPSISSAYTDLVIVTQAQHNNTYGNFWMRVGNGTVDSGTNYNYTYIQTNGSTTNGGSSASATGLLITPSATGISNIEDINSTINIMNYSTTANLFKPILMEVGAAGQGVQIMAGNWRNQSSAINIISFFTNSGSDTFKAGSTFSIYGIARA
jgi:hypothetical protein